MKYYTPEELADLVLSGYEFVDPKAAEDVRPIVVASIRAGQTNVLNYVRTVWWLFCGRHVQTKEAVQSFAAAVDEKFREIDPEG